MFENMDKLYLAIIFICITIYDIKLVQPNFIYNHKQNCLRQFGVGYKHCTVVTLWIASILLAIFSYFIVIYSYYIRNKWY